MTFVVCFLFVPFFKDYHKETSPFLYIWGGAPKWGPGECLLQMVFRFTWKQNLLTV